MTEHLLNRSQVGTAGEQVRARKADRLEAAAEAPDDDTATADPGAVMAKLEALHKAFDDDQINFDDFEEAKQELLSQLQV